MPRSMLFRRTLLAALALGALPLSAYAQTPNFTGKTIRLIVAFPPGGPVDFVARVIAEPLGKELGAQVIVENKPGANGALGAEATVRAAPDGTTLWLSSVGAVAINPSLYEKLSYEPQRDLAPVSLVVNNIEVLVVNPKDPANNAAELIAAARSAKTTPTFASSGAGSIPHLAMEQLADSAKMALQHIPYKGAAPAITDVMGGQVQAFFGDIPGLIGHIKSGKVKALGVASEKRHPLLPEVKTLAEQGFSGIDSDNWYGLFATSKTPADTIAVLNAAVRRAIAQPAVRDKLAASGAEPLSSTSAELAALLKRDTEKWARVIKSKNIKDQ